MTRADTSTEGAPSQGTNVILLLRLEGAAVLGASVFAYAWLDQSWLLFAVLLLVPDVSMLAYLGPPRFGAVVYNLVHTYVGPALLALAGLVLGPWAFGVAAIWVAHIGLDRMLGFGLKLGGAFKRTHLSPDGGARQ